MYIFVHVGVNGLRKSFFRSQRKKSITLGSTRQVLYIDIFSRDLKTEFLVHSCSTNVLFTFYSNPKDNFFSRIRSGSGVSPCVKTRFGFRSINQSRQEPSHHRLGKGGTNVPPPISKYFSEIFSPSHIKLTNKPRIWTFNRFSDRRNSRILKKIVKYFLVEK